MKIIRHSERIENVEYGLVFDRKDSPGSGFSFPCDKDGNLILREDGSTDRGVSPVGMDSYRDCTDGSLDVIGPYIRKYVNVYRQPAVGECDTCHREVELYDPMTNECECGSLYNGGGQHLAPRSQWEDYENEDDPAPYNVMHGYTRGEE